MVLSDDAPAESANTWKEFLAAGDGGAGAGAATLVGDGDQPATWSPRPARCSAEGRRHHPRPDPAGVRDLDRPGGLRHGDRYLIVNPFFHTFGYKAGVIACLMRGATMNPQPVFNVDTVLANIVGGGAGVGAAGPARLHEVTADHPARDAHDLSALRLVVTGAAVVPLRLVERLRGELGVDTVRTAPASPRRAASSRCAAAATTSAIPAFMLWLGDPGHRDNGGGRPGRAGWSRCSRRDPGPRLQRHARLLPGRSRRWRKVLGEDRPAANGATWVLA
ncbi:Fatty acid--CoA ligase family protein OS=Streptomyces alboniger OX=132473 GN=CP975_15095 PE=3 SV=1 [Streptomyces alboniger]